MKIENKIKYNRLKEALIHWVLEGGRVRVLDAIPWGGRNRVSYPLGRCF